jgi:hypothetical protein
MIEEFVTNELFRHCKFLNMDQQLAWSDEQNSVCQTVIRGLKVSEAVDQRKWWAEARKWVNRRIKSCLSDRNTAMKKAFYGKCRQYHGLFILPLTI